MTRLHDWQLRYAAFARERAAMPFAWGANDCCLFAADAVLALTGTDPAAQLRGTYSTALGAMRVLKEHWGVAGLATNVLGASMPPALAGVGDVVLIETGDYHALAICNGTSVIGAGERGIVGYGIGAAKAAWRIG
jgi:hypothetical protein